MVGDCCIVLSPWPALIFPVSWNGEKVVTSISICTHPQCAAVRTQSLEMTDPPQNQVLSIVRPTCHGNWPRLATIPLVIRWSPSGTLTFPENSDKQKFALGYQYIWLWKLKYEKLYVFIQVFRPIIHAYSFISLKKLRQHQKIITWLWLGAPLEIREMFRTLLLCRHNGAPFL